jgi:hypothetical protein
VPLVPLFECILFTHLLGVGGHVLVVHGGRVEALAADRAREAVPPGVHGRVDAQPGGRLERLAALGARRRRRHRVPALVRDQLARRRDHLAAVAASRRPGMGGFLSLFTVTINNRNL